MTIPTTPAALLVDLAKSYALSEFYPLSHPTLVQALHRVEGALLKLGTELRVEVLPGGLSVGNELAARRSPHVQRFGARMAEHGVSSFTIEAEVGADSLGRFLSGVALPPRVARAAGGLANALSAGGVRGVLIDDVRVVPSEAPPAAPASPRAEQGPAAPASGLELWSAHDMYEVVRATASRVTHENVEELRRLLREANDSERLEVLNRLEMVAQWTVEQGMMDRAVSLIEDLRRDAEHLAARSPAVRGHVMLAIHRTATRTVIEELVVRLGKARSEEERAGLRSTLLHIGADVVSPLVNSLSGATEVSARRAYRDALVSLDHVGVPLLEEMVGDERWFVVRNMVGILGEIRSADAIEHFTRTIRHGDARVRRETILALTKLGGDEVVPLLVRGLGDPEAGLRAASALGLGLTKTHAAVTPLLARLGQENDAEVVLEVVRALGRIGDPRAIPVLAERAGGGRWLSRTPVPLRVEAVRALGEIGGDAARDVLQRLLRDRTPEVRDAAVKAVG